MAKIFSLDSLTIDKIAAGEVVESPAGCVKELIENALDAQATEIVIEIELGGRQKIQIKDNGIGMSADDLPLAVERFATSKIKRIEDLDTLNTMGFRGEALSAICSVSRVHIVTSDAASGSFPLYTAHALEVEGGVVGSQITALRERGTTITATDLFFNVPARRKFLRPPAKEAFEITRAVVSIALANPHVAFRLLHDGDVELHAPSESLQERIVRLFPTLTTSDLIPLSWNSGGFSLSGFVGSPKTLKANRTGQFISINQRPIQSLPISYAVKGGFGPACEPAKHPTFFLQIQLEPDQLDVNIHPQKKEVRLYQESWITTQVRDQVAKALLMQTAPEQQAPDQQAPDETIPHVVFAAEEKRAPVHFHMNPTFQPANFFNPPLEELQKEAEGQVQKPKQLTICETSYSIISIQKSYAFVLLEAPLLQEMGISSQKPLMAVVALEPLKRLIAFTSFSKKNLENSLIEISNNQLVFEPKVVRFSKSEADHLRTFIPLLEKCGFSLRPFGTSSYCIETIPKVVEEVDMEAFLRDLIHEGSGADSVEAVEQIWVENLARIAGRNMNKESGKQLQNLLKELFTMKPPYNDLAGKSVVHVIKEQELDRLFQT